MIDLSFPLHAPHGSALNTPGWLQEAALRCLLNNLDPEVAEDPERLVVYGGRGKAARSIEALTGIVRTLERLPNDHTLLVQSGKPVGVFRTHEMAPRVLIANSLLVPRWATLEKFWKLEEAGLIMYGQMTAGSWIYIGTQGILQGTYQTFLAVAEKRFGGSLAGTVTLTAGLGGMGGAQPLAVTMNGGVVICVEVDPQHIQRRLETGYLDEVADDLDDALARAEAARRDRRPLSIGLLGNAADVFPELLARDVPMDIVTDQTSAHDPLYGYVPRRIRPGSGGRAAPVRSRHLHQVGPGVDGGPLRGDGGIRPGRGRGLRLRQQPARRGADGRVRGRLRLPRIRACIHPRPVL